MLSTRHHPIQAKDHARHLFYLIMRGFMPEDVSAAEFGRLGILSFDLNGLKSFSECTSDEHTTRLLQTTSKIFLHKNGRTRGWAESLGIRMTPFAAGLR